MTALQFRPAVKHGSRLRLAFIGPAGSGKTYSSLAVATGLGGRIAVIDTERGSASKYADDFAFDVLELDSCSPDTYVEALHLAEVGGFDVIVVDSLSHAWIGKDGALQMVDDHARRERGNSFGAWRHVTPKHNAMVDALTQCAAHLIVTMRSKTEWVLEPDPKTGKQVPRKIGLAPVQRDGLEYEFDVVGDLDTDNVFVISKSRCSALSGKAIEKPGKQLATTLLTWLGGPARPPAPSTTPAPTIEAEPPDPQLVARLEASIAIEAGRGLEALEALALQLKELPEGESKDHLRKLYRDAWNACKTKAANPAPAPSTDESAAPPSSQSPPSAGPAPSTGSSSAGRTTKTTSVRGEARGRRADPSPAPAPAPEPDQTALPMGPPPGVPDGPPREDAAELHELAMTLDQIRDNPDWMQATGERIRKLRDGMAKASLWDRWVSIKRELELEAAAADAAAEEVDRG